MTMEAGQPNRAWVLFLAVAVEGGLVGLAGLGGWLLGPDPLGTLRWEPIDLLWGMLAAMPMLVLFAVCIISNSGPLARIRQLTAELIQPLFAPLTVGDLALVSLLAGLGEEMLFRGVLQSGLSDCWGTTAGLVGASLLFGICHALTATYALLATLMGAYLGWLWLVSGNLLVPVVAHALYDFVALLFIRFHQFPNERASPPAADHPE
jgi:membrane protease YdiL (CAAX protease family)